MWVRFAADFDWNPPQFNGRVTMAFKTGTVANVTRACAAAAMAAGKATKATRKTDDGEAGGR